MPNGHGDPDLWTAIGAGIGGALTALGGKLGIDRIRSGRVTEDAEDEVKEIAEQIVATREVVRATSDKLLMIFQEHDKQEAIFQDRVKVALDGLSRTVEKLGTNTADLASAIHSLSERIHGIGERK